MNKRMNLVDMLGVLTTATLYLLMYLCLFPAVCPVYSHTVGGERESGKHYSDSCSRGSDYTGNEEKEKREGDSKEKYKV